MLIVVVSSAARACGCQSKRPITNRPPRHIEPLNSFCMTTSFVNPSQGYPLPKEIHRRVFPHLNRRHQPDVLVFENVTVVYEAPNLLRSIEAHDYEHRAASRNGNCVVPNSLRIWVVVIKFVIGRRASGDR